jgi:hypothetical protein
VTTTGGNTRIQDTTATNFNPTKTETFVATTEPTRTDPTRDFTDGQTKYTKADKLTGKTYLKTRIPE